MIDETSFSRKSANHDIDPSLPTIPMGLKLPEDPPCPKTLPVNKVYKFFGFDGSIPFDRNRTVTSPYIRPVTLGVIRLLLGLYMLASFLVHFTLLATQKNKWLRKQAWKALGDIMIHSFLGLTAYFLVSAYHTLFYAAKKRNPLASWPRSLQLTHLILQSTILSFPLFCTIIYAIWSLPALPGWHTKPQTRWSTVTFYMLNSAFSYTELCLSATRPRPWSHLTFLVLFLGLYLAFHSLLVAATNGNVWIYTVLKFNLIINQGWISAIRVGGLCVLSCLSFCLMQFVIWLKCRYLGGLFLPSPDLNGIESEKPVQEEDVESGSQSSDI